MATDDYQQQHGLKQGQVVVVMVPLPAQGHLNQLLQLSRIISSYDIHVHYVGTTTHTRQAKTRVHGWNPQSKTNIHFHEFSTPTFPTPPPDPNATSKFPSHLLPSFYAASSLREPVGALLRSLSTTFTRVIVIYDSLMTSAIQDVPLLPNAESYRFMSISAFAVFSFFWDATGKPSPFEAQLPKDAVSFEFPPDFMEFVEINLGSAGFDSGDVYNACKAMEGQFLDMIEKEQISGAKRQWAIGPFNPIEIDQDKNSDDRRHGCLEWLDNQAPNSVIFVSFGTTTSLRDEQIKELAKGLEESMQKFIWVLRDADKGDVFTGEVRVAELPKGFEERVKGRGIVVRDWAPQLEILDHPATGGFMSHCGWNSCMESISMGVPIAAWPMHSDQSYNALLTAEFLKIGLLVSDWRRRDELVMASTVERAVRTLMASAEGDEIRNRAKKMSEAVQQSVAEGGVTQMELNSFIAHITR